MIKTNSNMKHTKTALFILAAMLFTISISDRLLGDKKFVRRN